MEVYMQKTILLYIVLVLIIYGAKPSCFFNQNDSLKKFGLNKGNEETATLFSFHIIVIILGIITFMGTILLS